MVASAHASPEDLPGLIGDLAADRARQSLVADALVSELVMGSARELADARRITTMAAIDSATADLLAGEDEDRTALGRALGTVRNCAEVLDANLVERNAAASYLIALTRIAHETVAAQCAETGVRTSIVPPGSCPPLADMPGYHLPSRHRRSPPHVTTLPGP